MIQKIKRGDWQKTWPQHVRGQAEFLYFIPLIQLFRSSKTKKPCAFYCKNHWSLTCWGGILNSLLNLWLASDNFHYSVLSPLQAKEKNLVSQLVKRSFLANLSPFRTLWLFGSFRFFSKNKLRLLASIIVF